MSGSKSPTPDATPIIPDINIDKLKPSMWAKEWSNYQDVLLHTGVEWGVRLIVAILILVIGWVIGNWINRRFENARHLDNTLKNFLGGLFKYFIVFMAIIMVIGLFGIPLASLLAVLGAAGLAIGLALQGTLSNIASGVMLLILRPFNVGDYIEFGTQGGTVKTLGLFGTELAMADNVYVFAPNSKIWGAEIRNYSRNIMRRQDLTISIGYGDDLNKAMEIIYKVINADERITQDPDDKKPVVVSDTLGDYSTDLIIRFWSNNSDYWNLRWDITKGIKDALEAQGYTLPVTTRQLAITTK